MTAAPDESFTISVGTRRIRVNYRKDGAHHVFTTPDVAKCSCFATDKNKAYTGFHKRLLDALK
jgi:hypothetical protein